MKTPVRWQKPLLLRPRDTVHVVARAGPFDRPTFEDGLALLASARVRATPRLLGAAAFLSVGGVVLNRVNVVVGGMMLKGAAPQNAPQPYFPSAVEWGISLGLVAATIFLFGLGARLMPVLPMDPARASNSPMKEEASGRVA